VVRATVPGMSEFDEIVLRAFRDQWGSEDDGRYDDDSYDDEVPRAPLPLEPALRASLVRAIDIGLAERGCDNTLRAARAWARREKVRWGWLRNALEERGGFCDCEVLFNVVPPPEE
jgi:Protein of unknown function (DUF2695)